MVKQILAKWESINPWHFVWIGIIASEILTALLSVVISLILWGNVSYQVLIVGFFDALIVSFLVVSITVFFIMRNSSLSEINKRLTIEIDKHKQTEIALQESEERLKAIFENAKEGLLVADAKTRRLIDANAMMTMMIGYSHEEIMNLTVSDIHRKEDLQFVVEQFEKLVRNEIPEANHIPFKRKDGTVFYAEVNASPFKIAGNHYLAGFFRDKTEHYKLEEELRQSQKMAAVGILAGGLAHEFNNILATIEGSAYIIQKKLNENDPLLKHTEQINASINRAKNLSQSLLSFSRKQVVDLRPLNVNEIIERVKSLVSGLIGEHIEVAIELAEGDMTVMGDANQMEQTLINLITNARDAMPDGGRITLKTFHQEMGEAFIREHGFGLPGKYAVISVSDTGTGMPQDIKDKMFDPFFTTKEVDKGTGLGLSVVYGIMKRHNSFIDIDTKVNEGTTVKLYIPLTEPKPAEVTDQGRPSVTGGLETILFAEDDADTRAIMSEVLKDEGYNVLEAVDGEDAIRIFRENKERINLALLDVRMPKRNGKEVHYEIRRMRPTIKTLLISGYTADVIQSDAFNELGLNFISKSASLKEILGEIRKILDRPVSGGRE